jgi:tetratricopeptide (TPR) repeat protein
MDTANRYFRKVIELVPGSRIAEYAKRSITTSQQKTPGEGKKEDREHLFSDGMGHFLSGEYRLAANKYKEYLSDHPSDDYAWYLLGESRLRTGELEESADCFKRAIKLNSNRGLYYKSLGIPLHFLGRSGEVVEVIKKALEMGKKDALALTMYGINLHRERRVEEAIHSFQHTLKINPNNPLALYNLALAYIQTQSLDQAEKLLQSILKFEYYVPLKEQAKHLLDTMER